MKTYGKNPGFVVGGMVVLMFVMLCSSAAAQHRRPNPGWSVEGELIFRGNMKIEGSGTSYLQELNIQAARARQTTVPRMVGDGPDVGPLVDEYGMGTGDRDFDDGYVHIDEETENDGFTENWGYERDEQYNPDARTLTFTRRSTERSFEEGRGRQQSTAVTTDFSGQFKDDTEFDALGLGVKALYEMFVDDRYSVALTFGVRGFIGMEEKMSGSTYRQTVTERDFTVVDRLDFNDQIIDTYTFGTVSDVIPPAPFEGEYGIGGPMIENAPDSAVRDHTREGDGVTRTVSQTRQTVWTAANQIDIDVDADLYQFALGARLSMPVGDRLNLSLHPSVLINYLDVEIKRNEQFVATYQDGSSEVLNAWHDRKSSTEWLPGFAVQLGVDAMITDNVFAGLRGGYEWINKTSVTIGPNKVEMDFSGYTASAVAGLNF